MCHTGQHAKESLIKSLDDGLQRACSKTNTVAGPRVRLPGACCYLCVAAI